MLIKFSWKVLFPINLSIAWFMHESFCVFLINRVFLINIRYIFHHICKEVKIYAVNKEHNENLLEWSLNYATALMFNQIYISLILKLVTEIRERETKYKGILLSRPKLREMTAFA